MASLYDSTQRARKITVFILIGVVILLLIQTFIKSSNNDLGLTSESTSLYMFPSRIFGELAKPNITSLEYNKGATFIREGFHATFPDMSYVYEIKKPTAKLTTFDDALTIVNLLGFDEKSFTVVDSSKELKQYRWEKDSGTKYITFDTETFQWNMDTLFYENLEASTAKIQVDNINQYANKAKTVITKLWPNSKGLSGGVADVRFARLGLDGVFFEAETSDDGNFVIMNIYRELPQADPIVGTATTTTTTPAGTTSVTAVATTGKVYKSDPRRGSLRLTVSNVVKDMKKDIFKIEFTDFNYGNIGAYSIITPDEALTLVQQGEGSLVSLQPQGADYFADFSAADITEFRVDALKTEQGFWEPETWTGYVYPIYIFRGIARLSDGTLANFTFYVDAIKRI